VTHRIYRTIYFGAGERLLAAIPAPSEKQFFSLSDSLRWFGSAKKKIGKKETSPACAIGDSAHLVQPCAAQNHLLANRDKDI